MSRVANLGLDLRRYPCRMPGVRLLFITLRVRIRAPTEDAFAWPQYPKPQNKPLRD